MKITITYCVPSDYRPRAARVAVAIENSFGLKPELVDGADGIFDVAVDGEVIFSKQETGEFIEPPEIVELIRANMDELSV